MTADERQKLKDEIIEEVMLLCPRIMAELVNERIIADKLKAKFYSDNKEFQKHLDIVAKVLEKTDGENPGIGLEKMLDLAAPEIQKTIDQIKDKNLTDMTRPDKLALRLNDLPGGSNQGTL